MPLYRLDLGSIVNKYVGETEKNLGRVLDEVAERDFILLIDEADALFGKRTDAGSSGERFANMLTNFLLSRMESHRGIIILTTNGFSRIDSAFLRRLECIIEFQAPEMEERVRLWSAHLGERNPGEHYCRLLASLCDLSGGFIRNAVLAAAAEVPYEQSSALSFNQLLYSIASEYRKSGKPVPPKLASYLVSSPRPDSSGA